MSIVQLKSENKDFSFIISKNPATGMQAKGMRQGTIFGYYTKGNEQEYNLFFKDGSDEVSFPSHEGETFEYLNTSRYNSATFVVSAIDDMLRSAFKSDEYQTMDGLKKDEGGNESVFFINMIYVWNSRYIDAFNDYFPDYKVEHEVVSGKNYQIKITTKKSIYELLNFASLFGIFQAIVNNEPMLVNEENAMKYVRCMNIIDAPYFVRYLFKKRFLINFKTFNSVKDDLSKNTQKNIEIKYGDTWQARQMAIQERLDFRNSILDVGCGEGKYITRFNRFMEDHNYFAVDIDDEVREKAEKRVKRKGLKNVEFFKSTLEFCNSDKSKERVDVICTEVIEHMPKEESHLLMLDIISCNVGTLIVTTPDVRFNDNYFMEGMRHEDHDWEPTREEFEDFMNKSLETKKEKIESIEWFGIGDIVEGVSPSQGIIVKFK